MAEQSQGKHLIDRIIYLASLVSEPRSVDTTLDKLRTITAHDSGPSPEDIQELTLIRNELEDYLIRKERLRAFSAESLREHMDRHFASEDPVRVTKRAAQRQILATVGVCALITGIPALAGLMKGQVVLAFFICTLFIGLSFIFQSMKRDLVEQLRGSMSYLMAATIGTGLFAVNFPVISALQLDRFRFFQHGGLLESAIPVYACYYIAFYLYARQLNVTIPRALRPAFVALGAVMVTLACVFVPHPIAVPDEWFFDLAMIGFGVSVYLSAMAAILCFMTIPKTTARYSQSTLFLAISMVLQTLGNGYFLLGVTFTSGDFAVNEPRGQVVTGLLIMAALVAQYIAAYRSKTSLA